MWKKWINKISLGAVAICVIIVFFIILSQDKITLKENKFIFSYDEPLPSQASYYFNSKNTSLEKEMIDLSSVSSNKMGDYEITFVYKSKSYVIPISIVDDKAPVFTIEQYYSVYKNSDFNIESIIKDIDEISSYTINYSPEVNTNTKGVQHITITLTDEFGNESSQETEIEVIDKTSVFTLNKNASLEQNIKNYLYIHDLENHYSISFLNFTTQESFSIKGDKEYVAASTIKVALALAYYDLIREGKINLQHKLTYNEEDYQGGAGQIRFDPVGSQYTIERLLEVAITQSDNIATTLLFNHLYGVVKIPGGNYLSQKYGISYQSEHRVITSNDGIKILKILYDNEGNNPYYSKLKEHLLKTTVTKRMDLYIPKHIVAHKVGDLDGYLHDIGIIYDNHPFAIAILSYQGKNEHTGRLAEIFFQYLNGGNQDVASAS